MSSKLNCYKGFLDPGFFPDTSPTPANNQNGNNNNNNQDKEPSTATEISISTLFSQPQPTSQTYTIRGLDPLVAHNEYDQPANYCTQWQLYQRRQATLETKSSNDNSSENTLSTEKPPTLGQQNSEPPITKPATENVSTSTANQQTGNIPRSDPIDIPGPQRPRPRPPQNERYRRYRRYYN